MLKSSGTQILPKWVQNWLFFNRIFVQTFEKVHSKNSLVNRGLEVLKIRQKYFS